MSAPFLLFLCQCPSGCVAVLFGHQFLSLFATDAVVIDAGMQRIRIMAFYAVSVFMDCTTAASRGIGKTIVPTIIILLGSCAFRIIWIYTIFVLDSYHSVTLSAVCFFVAYHFSRRNHLFYYQLSETEMLNNCHF